MTPAPTRIELPLLELMLNAIEHGNLELGCTRKRELVHSGELEAEIARRHTTAPYNGRIVRIEVAVFVDGARFVITDEGPGFSWQTAVCCGANETAPTGRGLQLARAWADSVVFNERGNTVTVEVRW